MPRTTARTLRWVIRLVAVTLVALLAAALHRARERARDVPLSPVAAGWFVGPNFVHRAGLVAEDPTSIDGELDDVGTLAGDTFDPDRLDPEVRRFYERTGAYDLRYRTRWHPPFRTGAALATRVTSRIEQLNLPGPDDESWHRLESRFLDVEEPGADEKAAPEQPVREDVRAWVRTNPVTGEAVFVALYATHHRGGDGFVNITVPLPGGGIDTVLRPVNLDRGDGEGTGVRFTTYGTGDPGLYLRTPVGALELPAEQEFEVWREAEDGDRTGLRGTHEMWLLGRRLLTVEYGIERA
ncbi:MAG: hypothetical protein ABEH90_08470 [Halolamina sp.]